MRGFGITGVDFAIETHMDKVAHLVGMDPIELRIFNAYRDGDMKAHRRIAKNTAVIECCQVAAEKAKWSISPAARRASSLRDGGGTRAELPARTATDENGRVTGGRTGSYARKTRRQEQPSAPQPQATPTFTTPAAPTLSPSARQPSPQYQPPAGARPEPPAPPPAPPPPAAPDQRRAPIRFSSISGLRRR
jgi:CO/xanthine dehydrogenase Mo-binding subunit